MINDIIKLVVGVVIITAVIVVPAAYGLYLIERATCKRFATANNTSYTFSFFGGCLVSWEGKVISPDVIRLNELRGGAL